MRYYVILLFLITHSFNSYSQMGWEPWEILYFDSSVTVEVQFRLSDNSCELDGKKFKFRTRVRGELKSYNLFVNWKMDYTDCNGNEFYQQNSVPIWKLGGGPSSEIPSESIDDIFTAKSLDRMHYDEEIDYFAKSGSGTKGVVQSIEPKGIVGKNKINYGESIILSVSGGVLGEGADWVWFKDTCGSAQIGLGASIKIQPVNTTVYFVRAEGRDNITNCVQLTVNVNQNSKPPDAIILKTPACKGVPNTLKVGGGYLGLDAVWKWYEDSCDGNFIGTGNFISINPSQKTTYFVRAEGKTNKTTCAKLVVTPFEKSLNPTTPIITKANSVCEGDSIILSIADKGLSADARWSWSKDYCGETPLGTGPVLRLKADTTTTFFVRGEGKCNNTRCVSTIIEVNDKSVMPDKIITSPDSGKIYKGKNTELSLSGGALGKDANWNWYKGSCDKGQFLGNGESIIVRPSKKRFYYVKAVGLCNSTECQSVLIIPTRQHYFSRQYTSKLKKSYHIGGGFGIENYEMSNLVHYNLKDTAGKLLSTDSVTNFLNGSGLKADLYYHPFFNQYLSVGLFTSYAQGTTTLFLLGNKSADLISHTEVKYEYKRVNIGMDLAFGFKKFKVLGSFNRSSQTNDFEKITTSRNFIREYTFNHKFNKELLSFGFRFGGYTSPNKDKRPHNFDVLCNLQRNISTNIFYTNFKDYKDFSEWNVGLTLNYWVQSRVNLRLDVMSNTKRKDLNKLNLGQLYYLASLTFNIDRFRNYK